MSIVNTKQRLLVADDDAGIRMGLSCALAFAGYEVDLAATGADALTRAAQHNLDLLILDIMMPGLNGLDICRRLRAVGDHTPILVLSARATLGDLVAGLDSGADDYLAKPFALPELLARVRALLRRTSHLAHRTALPQVAGLTVNRESRQVHRGGQSIHLTRIEYNLLLFLLDHTGRVLTRSQLFQHVWGYDLNASSNTLDVYIGYLRKKLEAAGGPRILHTVRGVGYVIRDP